MDSAVAQCPRCKQPVPPNASVCFHCGDRLVSTQRIPLYIGIVGVLALIFVAVIMMRVAQKNDFADKPAAGDTEHSAPAAPDKQPPLNR
jgi:hypothetical protein